MLAAASSSRAAAAVGGGGTAGEPQAQIGGPSGTELAEQQVLHVGNGAELQTLDPHRAEDIAELQRAHATSTKGSSARRRTAI